jgi:hypothetical protein
MATKTNMEDQQVFPHIIVIESDIGFPHSARIVLQ